MSLLQEAQEEASQVDDLVEWTDPVDSIVRDTVPRNIIEKDVSLRYDSLFYESSIFIHNMMICAGVTHRNR